MMKRMFFLIYISRAGRFTDKRCSGDNLTNATTKTSHVELATKTAHTFQQTTASKFSKRLCLGFHLDYPGL